MAYVYDYANLTQYVYINGVLDVSGSPKGPYQGTVGNLTIGTNGVRYPSNYWDGCIDLVTYSARAKRFVLSLDNLHQHHSNFVFSAAEILREATLTVALTFDNNLIDSGPLGINGSGSSYSFNASGRRNQSLSLVGSLSYVQATGLVLLGTVGQSYSIAIWIKPTVVVNSTIVHVSSLGYGLGWCIPMLGFSSTGRISGQSWNGSIVSLTGPFVTANAWTHLVLTYVSTVGIRLWVNGT